MTSNDLWGNISFDYKKWVYYIIFIEISSQFYHDETIYSKEK